MWQGRERFIYLNCPLQGDVMIELQDMSGAFNPNNVGMQMLWGGAFGSNYKLSNGRMVMEDDAGERWMLPTPVGTGGCAHRFLPGPSRDRHLRQNIAHVF